ncbi:MAG: hypothetical protein NZM43_13600, partial [Saprospiraceae bacterium]|nr:hypothetical protein [Saprospiraceae bacterium]MDW8485349.1 hypothetical protein [Saprospiraceae bacterium]
EPTGASMPAAEAIEKTEIAFNLYQGNPTVPFEFYESIERDLAVSANENWTPAQVVAFYDTVKAIAVQAIGGSTNRRLHVLSLSNPEEREGGGVAVRVMLQVGINPVTEVGEPSQQITRWTKAPIGHTHPTPCDGEADNEIGRLANAFIGVYAAQNAPPGVPLPGRAVTRIVWGVHKLFNKPYNPNPPLPFPKVYEIYTYGVTSLQSRHYNSIEYGGGNPPWNCLNNLAIIGFTGGNIFLGNSARTRPEVLMVKINGVSFERSLVCTRVRGFRGEEGVEGSEYMKYQEHLTEHYFGVLAFIDSVPFPISEM